MYRHLQEPYFFNNTFTLSQIKPKRRFKFNPKKGGAILVGFFKNFLSTSTIHGLAYLAESKRHIIEM